jgi:beta-galactosidase
VVAQHNDQFYAKRAAAVTRKLGRGSVTYIGVDSKDGELEAALIRGVYARANVPIANYDDGFVIDWRDGFWVATNFTEKTLSVPAGEGAQLLVGERQIGPAGVAVWQE